jgi:hypothetical protein
MIIGFVLATVLQILQKYTKLKSFFNVKLFLVLAILLIMAWMLSFAIGGGNGLGINAISLSLLVVVFSGLLSSFVLNLFITD